MVRIDDGKMVAQYSCFLDDLDTSHRFFALLGLQHGHGQECFQDRSIGRRRINFATGVRLH